MKEILYFRQDPVESELLLLLRHRHRIPRRMVWTEYVSVLGSYLLQWVTMDDRFRVSFVLAIFH